MSLTLDQLKTEVNKWLDFHGQHLLDKLSFIDLEKENPEEIEEITPEDFWCEIMFGCGDFFVCQRIPLGKILNLTEIQRQRLGYQIIKEDERIAESRQVEVANAINSILSDE